MFVYAIHEIGDAPHQLTIDNLLRLVEFKNSNSCSHVNDLSSIQASLGYKKSYLLTFDDATKTILPAIDELNNINLRPTVFSSTYNSVNSMPYWWNVNGLKLFSHIRVASLDREIQNGPEAVSAELFPISLQKLISLNDNNLINLGAHGHHHEIFTRLTKDELNNEIVSSDYEFSKYAFRPIAFAYPNGNFNRMTSSVVNVRYKFCFSGVHRIARSSDKCIPRFFICNNNLDYYIRPNLYSLFHLKKYFSSVIRYEILK